MAKSASYEEWKHAAELYDKAKGFDKWKNIERSEYFDYRSIRARLDLTKKLRLNGDYAGLLFALNEGIHGNMGGMGKSELYNQAKVGTKRLIEAYIDEIATSLLLLAEDNPAISEEQRSDFFYRANHCFGQSALMMSGSGTLAYFHLGVAKSLWQQDLLPNVLSGSSGGALIGAFMATRSDVELETYFNSHSFSSQQANESSWLEKYKFKVISPTDFRAYIESLIPDLTFQEAYEKTGRSINISIAPVEAHQTSRLLNAITSPNVLIRDAIMASSAVPGIFPAVTLKAKDHDGNTSDYLPHRQWVDGAISDDLPAKRLSRLYGVNHFIVSQTNPHILPFISENQSGTRSILKRALSNTAREWINAGANILNRPISKFPALHQVSNSMLGVINQDYMGDINIIPPFKFRNPARLLAPLTKDEIGELISMGERATWPKMEMIRIQTKISRTLNHILQQHQYKQ